VHLVPKAQAFARRFHVRSDGSPQMYGDETYYDGHLTPVALLVEAFGGSPQQIASAYLHDAPEDTLLTLGAVMDEFGYVVHRTVDALTRREDEEYDDYIRRVIEDPNARLIKWCDASVNYKKSIRSLVDNPDDEKAMYRVNKYRIVLASLGRYVL